MRDLESFQNFPGGGLELAALRHKWEGPYPNSYIASMILVGDKTTGFYCEYNCIVQVNADGSLWSHFRYFRSFRDMNRSEWRGTRVLFNAPIQDVLMSLQDELE